MRRLIVLRHGKAEDSSPEGDFGRRLKGRGERDAEAAGKEILRFAVLPVAVVTSDAARALKTAQLATKELVAQEAIVTDHRIYDASVDDLMDVIRDFDDRHQTVILVGHNPGLEGVVHALCEEAGYDFRLSPASFAVLEADVPAWGEFRAASARLVHIAHP